MCVNISQFLFLCFLQETSILLIAQVKNLRGTLASSFYLTHLMASVIKSNIFCPCWTVVLEKTLESPLDCKEIKPVNPKGNQSWIFIGKPDAEAEVARDTKFSNIHWPPDANSRLIRKDPDAGKDWRQEEKHMTVDKMVRWHHWLNGHEYEQAPGGGEGQGNPVCYSPLSHKDSDTTEQLNKTENIWWIS